MPGLQVLKAFLHKFVLKNSLKPLRLFRGVKAQQRYCLVISIVMSMSVMQNGRGAIH